MKGCVSCSGVDGHVSGSPACPPMSRLSQSLIRRVCSWPGGRLILDPGAQPVPPAPSRLEEGRAVHLCPGDLRSPRCAAVLQAYGASEGAVREAGGRELAGEQRRRGGAKQSLQGNGARLSTVGGGGGGMGRWCPRPPEAGVCGEPEATVALSPRSFGRSAPFLPLRAPASGGLDS